MELPHDAVIYKAETYEAIGHWVTQLSRVGFTVVVHDLEFAVSQTASVWMEVQR